ncbi:VOC family protein [Nonomuraea sp. NPDC050556]|uniref:VOC family protein n=1 Tax=Nonomuraea sp. NPDC050556 TaxID=3364369 RepID=UPI00379D559B
MSERNGYQPGVPCWVDLSSTDVPASTRFYGDLFGWSAEMVDDPAAGGYGQFVYNGKKVAGVGPSFAEGMPSVWNVYVSTSDIAATADKVKNSGGQVVMEPMAIFEEGSMAVFQTPDGAFVSAWQPGNHQGAELVNEPGAFCWNELVSSDVEAAKRFYPSAFGWTEHTQEMEGMQYTEWQIGGDSVAGMMAMSPDYPEGTPSHWSTYFAVADLDATIAKARELGATVMVDAMDSPFGRFGMLMDPQGAGLAVIQLNENG